MTTPPIKLEWDSCDQKPTSGIFQNPRREDVEYILDHLGRCRCGFVILSVTEQRYLQTIFASPDDPAKGFDVEYQAGSVSRHYGLPGALADIAAVKRLFLSYYDDPACVRSLGDWQKMKLDV